MGTQYVHMQSACPGRGRYGQRIYRKGGNEEERPARIKSDAQDTRNILHKLQSCIDPMDPTNHPDELVNIVTGRVSPGTVNAGLSVQIGTAQQKVVLTVTENKIQLLDIICQQLVEIYQAEHVQDAHRLVITGKKVVPVEVFKGIAINRNKLATNGISCINILCDDTDVLPCSSTITCTVT